MLVKVLLSIICLILFVFIPYRIWAHIYNLLDSLKRGDIKNGRKLLRVITVVGQKNSSILNSEDFPQYKFFTRVIHILCKYRRSYGISINRSLLQIRENLNKDIQFNKKVREELYSAIFQFISIALVTWGFIGFVIFSLSINANLETYLIIAFLQALGTIFFLIFYHMRTTRIFAPYGNAFETLFLIITLSEAKNSIKDTLKLSNTNIFLQDNYRELALIQGKLREIITDWKNGMPIYQSLQEAIDETWSLLHIRFESFIKELSLVKFLSLAICFLSGYFLYIKQLFTIFFIE